jgi:hypothetical protein
VAGGRVQGPEELAGEVTLQASPNFPIRSSFGLPAFNVSAGVGVVGHPDNRRLMEGPVQPTITSPVAAIPDGVAR